MNIQHASKETQTIYTYIRRHPYRQRYMCTNVSIRILRETEPIGYVWVCKEIYYKELPPTTVEAKQSDQESQ